MSLARSKRSEAATSRGRRYSMGKEGRRGDHPDQPPPSEQGGNHSGGTGGLHRLWQEPGENQGRLSDLRLRVRPRHG